MDCLDLTVGSHALVGASLVVAGSHLMMGGSETVRVYGSYCFALGYLILGLTASGNDLLDYDITNTRYLLGLGSAMAIVAGTFLTYYHVQDYLQKLLEGSVNPVLEKDILTVVPMIDNVLIYAGYAGLVLTISVDDDNNFDPVKAALAVAAFAVVGYTKDNLLLSLISGQELEKHQLYHLASWSLLLLAVMYKC